MAATATASSETTGTPAASASATATDDAPTVESPTATSFAQLRDVVPAGSLVRVTADGLRIRSGPSTDFDVLGVVNAGDILFVPAGSWGVDTVDDLAWYGIAHAPGYAGWPVEPDRSERVDGSVALRSGAEWFVELLPPECPQEASPALDVVVTMTPFERVACLGNRTLTFEGTFGCPFCDGLASPITYDPGWLAAPDFGFNGLAHSWDIYPPFPSSITLATPPDTEGPGADARGRIIRVTGHFDDDRAAGCVITPDPAEYGDRAPHPEWVEWYCRQKFVVESWESIGTDPDYEALIPG